MNISENFSVPASGPASIGSSGHQKRRRHEVESCVLHSSMKYSDQTTKHLNVKPAVSETSSPALNYFRLMILTSSLLFIWKILRTIICQPNTDIPGNSVRKLSPQKRINLFTLFLFSESEWKISVRGGDWSLQW